MNKRVDKAVSALEWIYDKVEVFPLLRNMGTRVVAFKSGEEGDTWKRLVIIFDNKGQIKEFRMMVGHNFSGISYESRVDKETEKVMRRIMFGRA